MLPDTSQDFKQTQLDFAQHIRNPQEFSENAALRNASLKEIEPRRLKIYSDLFYNNIEGFVASNFPVLKSIIADELWHDIIRFFMIKHRCQTPIFTEIGREFIQFLESDDFNTSEFISLIPEFTLELAYYEWMELVISIDTHRIDWEVYDGDNRTKEDLLSMTLEVSSLSKLGTFSYPVQHISDEFIPEEDDKQETSLLIYRDRQHQVNFMSLAPLSAILYQNFATIKESQGESTSVGSILENLHEQLNFNNWPEFKEAGLTIINDWCLKDILSYR